MSDNASMLVSMFPRIDRNRINATLKAENGDMDRTAARLLDETAAVPSSQPHSWATPAPSAPEVRMIVNARRSSESLYWVRKGLACHSYTHASDAP